MIGKMSIFGGIHDTFMKPEEGLSLYEHWEADKRPDIFSIRPMDLILGTSKRLKHNALYFAYRYDKNKSREDLQKEMFIFTNLDKKISVVCHLVDFGPREDLMRSFDISPYAASLLRLTTDDNVLGVPYCGKFN